MPRFLTSRRLKITGLLLVLMGLALLAAPFVLRWGADYYLREKAKIPVRLGHLYINPAISRVSLSLAGAKPGQELRLDLGALRFDWWTVFRRRLRLGRVHIEGLRLDVERDAAGRLTVGGIPLANEPAKTETPPQPSAGQAPPAHPWGVGVGAIDIHDVQLDYRDPEIKMSVLIHSFHMDPAESWQPNAQTPFEGDIEINGGHVHMTGSVRPFRADPSLDAHVQFTAFPIGWLAPVLKHPGLDGDFDATLIFDGLEVHPSSPTATVRLHVFELAKGRLKLIDHSLRPTFRWTIGSLALKLANINTADSTGVVPFDFDAMISRYEKISLKGHWTPLAPVPDGHVDLKVDGFNLVPFTPFAEKGVGYRLATGLVDLKTRVDVRHGLLEAGNKMVARKLHLDRLKADELDPSDQQIGLPLNLCLALIRDADDNIRLDVPLTGDLRDPKVPVAKLVWQLIGKALAAALRAAATAFFPSGTKLGFDPIVFAAGQAQLSPEGTAYLGKVGEKLSQRPEVSLRLSGLAVPADWYALKKKKLPDPMVPWDSAKLSPTDNDKLIALAAQREAAIQAYLVETHHIDPKRLLETAPKLDTTLTTPPRAELSL